MAPPQKKYKKIKLYGSIFVIFMVFLTFVFVGELFDFNVNTENIVPSNHKNDTDNLEIIHFKNDKGNISPDRAITEDTKAPFLIEKHTPSTTLHGSLLDHLDDLNNKYKSGDYEAGYVLAVNLSNCFYTKDNESQFKEEFAEIENNLTTNNDLREELPEHVQQFHFCFGVSRKIRNTYFEIVRNMANENYPPAQVLFSMLTPPELLDEKLSELPASKQSELIEAYMTESNRFLESAAYAGSLHAMMNLANNYQYGNKVAKNPIKALSLNLALLEFTENNELYIEIEKTRLALEGNLSSEELNEANTLSNEIIKKIRKNRTLYKFPL
ncbi:hypothetical protein [Thalassomonas actiniarum]|uniref:Uncharacterized protein n=1 Tax=Thalassomonas actiniarum TaxID=485447 RepID=A0AAE9YTN6_9GAMM|nr:hypothetical protein [Thalassomonas actiniarum]WDE01001.1 hypothetical protein SG35_010415 [Thalassomonas actiniarum]